MKKHTPKKAKIIICIILIVIIYFLFLMVSFSVADKLSNANSSTEVISVFPGGYILLLTLAFGATLLYLRKQIVKVWLRIVLMYFAVVNFLAAAYSIVLIVIKFVKF